MKQTMFLLSLMTFCFLSTSYAMEDKKEQIAKDLSRANGLLNTAENSIGVIDNFIKEFSMQEQGRCECSIVALRPEDKMRVYKAEQEVIRLTQQAYDLSDKVMNDGSVSPRTYNEAEASRRRAHVILHKYGVKK